MEPKILKSIYRNSTYTEYEPYQTLENYQTDNNYGQTSTYINTGNYNQTYFNTGSQYNDINNINLINELVENNLLNTNINYTPNYTPNYSNYSNINSNITNYSNINSDYSNINANFNSDYSNINSNITTNYNEYYSNSNTNYQNVIKKENPQQNSFNTLPVKYLSNEVIPSNQTIKVRDFKDIKEFATVIPINDIVKYKKKNFFSKKVNERNIRNKNFLINSPVINKEQTELNDYYSYMHKSPKISNKINILSPINSPLLNYETQSYDAENDFDIDEFFRLKEENEIFKEQLKELDRYKAEAAEARELKQQVEALSPLREQVAEMASLKAQLKELNELKAKVAELEKLRDQVENFEYTKEEDKKIYQLDEQKGKKYSEEEEEPNIINYNNEELDDKEEKTFVKGDIIQSIDELELLIRKINKDSDKITLNLLYKASADSDRAKVFHKKCDKAKNTLVFIETDKGKRFGGYTTVSWKGNGLEKYDEESFVFSLDKMKIYENIQGKKAIGCYPKYGPVFLGCQIRIFDHAFTKGGTTFQKGVNFNTEKDYELTGGDRVFNVKDIEVYEVIPQ